MIGQQILKSARILLHCDGHPSNRVILANCTTGHLIQSTHKVIRGYRRGAVIIDLLDASAIRPSPSPQPSPGGRGEEKGCRRPKTQDIIGDLARNPERTQGLERWTGGQCSAGVSSLRECYAKTLAEQRNAKMIGISCISTWFRIVIRLIFVS